MSVTAGNIIVGIGDFKIDGTSVGSTSGGVKISKELEMYEKNVDQSFDPMGYVKVIERYSVSTEVAETTLANLKIIWDIPNSISTDASSRTLSWGTSSSVTEHSLTFYGKSPEGYDRDFIVYKAIIKEAGETSLQKDELTVFPVVFGIIPDTSKPAGKQIGYIKDHITA